jgi:Protein of unknown function (DUF3987)/Domain of unknown function (DUF3854)
VKHSEWCHGSGITEEIAALNCQPIGDKAKIAEFLGWQGYQGADGWVCYGVDIETGEPTKFGQFKPHKPHKFEDGKTAKYLSPRTGYDAIALQMSDPLYWHRILEDPTARIVITEGVKKAAALLTCGIPAVALCGVDMGLLNKRSRLVPILAKLAVEGRPVTLAFDMDMLTKPGVRDALSWLGSKLKDKGCLVSIATWDEQHKGIDDLLVACGTQSIVDAISEAQSYSAWMSRPNQSTPNHGSNEAEDSEVEVLISQGSANPPQLFADGLTVPLKNLAHSLGLSVEPFVVCILPILGARLKAGTRLAIDPVTNYYAPPIIWAGLVGDSGTLKTPILRALTSPLDALQQEAFEDYQRLYSEYELELQQWESLKKDERLDKPKPKPPALKDLYFSDFTIEAIADSMRYYPEEGYLVHIDELAAFLRSMDAYRNGKGSDRQRWLTSYSGSALKVNRKSSEPIYLHKTSISLVGGIQPSVLEKQVLDDPTSEDGLWARFIWVRLPMTTSPGISDRPRFDLSQLLKSLYHSLNQVEAKTYLLSKDAQLLWNQWNSEIGQLIKQEPSGILRATYPKLKEAAARIALIIHIANAKLTSNPIEETLSGNTLNSAIQFTRWLMGQTRMLYCEIGTGGNPKASRIIRFVNRFRGCGTVKARTVTQWWGAKDRPSAQQTRKFMAEVVALGYAVSNGEPIDSSKYEIQIAECTNNPNKKLETFTGQRLDPVGTHPNNVPTIPTTYQQNGAGRSESIRDVVNCWGGVDPHPNTLKANRGEPLTDSVGIVGTFSQSKNSNGTQGNLLNPPSEEPDEYEGLL